jgi:hypothetical protein
MANRRINRLRIEIGATLVGQAETATIRMSSNDEQGHGEDGSNYFTDGNNTSEITMDAITPGDGYDIDMITMMVDKVDVDTSYTLGNQLWGSSGRFTEAEHKGESKTGMVKGNFKLVCGEPKLLGTVT